MRKTVLGSYGNLHYWYEWNESCDVCSHETASHGSKSMLTHWNPHWLVGMSLRRLWSNWGIIFYGIIEARRSLYGSWMFGIHGIWVKHIVQWQYSARPAEAIVYQCRRTGQSYCVIITSFIKFSYISVNVFTWVGFKK